MIFWLLYIASACTVAGVFTLLIRMELKQEKAVTVTLPEALIAGFLALCPYLNVFIAFVAAAFYISEYGKQHSISFGKEQDPK